MRTETGSITHAPTSDRSRTTATTQLAKSISETDGACFFSDYEHGNFSARTLSPVTLVFICLLWRRPARLEHLLHDHENNDHHGSGVEQACMSAIPPPTRYRPRAAGSALGRRHRSEPRRSMPSGRGARCAWRCCHGGGSSPTHWRAGTITSTLLVRQVPNPSHPTSLVDRLTTSSCPSGPSPHICSVGRDIAQGQLLRRAGTKP